MKISTFLFGFALTITAQDNFNGQVTCYECEGTTAPWDELNDDCFNEKMSSVKCSAGEFW